MAGRFALARAIDKTGLTGTLLRLRARTPSPWLPALIYHRVGDPRAQRPFDPEVVDVSPEDFDLQMGELARFFTPVGIDQLCDHFRGQPLPPNPVVVTFDDGYRDNHDVALPILQKHGVRAVFFVATRYLDERRLFWWDRINWIAAGSKNPVLEVDYPAPMRFDLQGDKRAVWRILRVVKDHYALDLPRFFVALERAAGISLDAAEEQRLADRLLMTWDQVRALRDAGMDVQSHTRTHRVLSTLPDAALQDELSGSRADLEQRLGAAPRAISYPVGGAAMLKPHVRAAVRAAGYEIAFTNYGGVNTVWSGLDRYDLKRLSVEWGWPHSYFRSMLAVPWLAAR